MTNLDLIKVVKEEILRTRNLNGEYLNEFLNKYTLNDYSANFINLDAVQIQAKYQLAREGFIVYNHNTNLYVWK